MARRSLIRPWLLAALLSVGCAQARSCDRGTGRYDRRELTQSLEQAEVDPGLVIGEFPLATKAIVDGDTIKVGGLDSSLRLLAIDTEETFKSKKDLQLYDRLGFEGYLAKKSEGTDRPAKCATPVGMDAKKWAQEFFAGVTRVRLERDHPKELRGRYGRLLAYVFVEKDGQWVNYNVEAVRAGMSPYFTKYGYSRRFHDEFVAAQDEAREAQRGIWDPGTEHYPDYDIRLRWWNARAEFIAAFEQEAAGRPDLVVLTHWDALDRLADLEGSEVEILGTVGSIRPREGNRPTSAMLSRRMFSDFPLVFFDDRVFERSRIDDASGEFIRVRGTVTAYRRKSRRSEQTSDQLQIVVKLPEQVKISKAHLAVEGVLGGVVGGLPGPASRSEAEGEPEPEAEPEAQPESNPEAEARPEGEAESEAESGSEATETSLPAASPDAPPPPDEDAR